MSQFPQPQPSSRLPRPSFSIDLPGGPSAQVQTPYIPEVTAAEDRTAEMVGGIINQFSGLVARIGADNQREADRAEIESQRAAARAARDEDERVKELYRAAKRTVATSVREMLPGDIDAISKGDPSMLPGEADQYDPEIFVDRLARQRLADLPEEVREDAIDYWKQLWAPRGTKAIYAKADSDRKKKADVALSAYGDEMIVAAQNNDLQLLGELLSTGVQTQGVEDGQVADRVAVTMVRLARNGDNPAAVQQMKSWLGESHQNEQIVADNLLERAAVRRQSEQYNEFQNVVARTMESVGKGETTLEAAETAIDRDARERGIEDKERVTALSAVRAGIQKQQAEAARAQFEQTVVAVKDARAASLIGQIAQGVRPVMDDTPIGFGPDGKAIVQTRAETIEAVQKGLRARHGWTYQTPLDREPVTAGWARMSPAQRDGYVNDMARAGIVDRELVAMVASAGTSLSGSNEAQPGDVVAVDTLRQIMGRNPAYAEQMVAAAGPPGDVAKLAAYMLEINPADTQGAITRAKSLYQRVGNRLNTVDPSAAGAIAAANPQLGGRIVEAIARDVELRMLTTPGADKNKVVNESVEKYKAFTIEVNGRPVPAGVLASNSEQERQARAAAATNLLNAKVKEFARADARLSGDIDDYTLEMVNADIYRVVRIADPTETPPRDIDPFIYMNDIENGAVAAMAPGPTRSVKQIEQELADAEKANEAVTRRNQEAALGGIDFEIGGVGTRRTYRMEPLIDVRALRNELAVARFKAEIERKRNKQ